MFEPFVLKPLGELADLRMGGTPSRAEPDFWDRDNAGHPWVSIGDLRGEYISRTKESVTKLGARAARLSAVPPGVPIMSFKLSMGRAAIPTVPVYTNEAIVALFPKSGISFAKWLYYSVPRVVQSAVTETAVKGQTLNLKKLRELLIPTPYTLEEQRRIAEILDALDDQIICQGKVVEKLGSVMQGLAEEQLSLVTRNVKTAYLGEISNVGSGVTLGGEVESGVELPYLRVANVQDGYIDTSEMKKVRVSRSEVARYLLEAGDVLLTEGGDIDKLGRGAVWDGRIDPCLCQNHIFRVRCRQDVVRPEFLAAYTGSTKGKAYFLSIAKQTTNLATINSTQLKEMPIPLPSIAEQDSFIRLMEDVKSRLDSEVAAADKLVALKQGLAEDLLTGRVRVPEAEAVVESL